MGGARLRGSLVSEEIQGNGPAFRTLRKFDEFAVRQRIVEIGRDFSLGEAQPVWTVFDTPAMQDNLRQINPRIPTHAEHEPQIRGYASQQVVQRVDGGASKTLNLVEHDQARPPVVLDRPDDSTQAIRALGWRTGTGKPRLLKSETEIMNDALGRIVLVERQPARDFISPFCTSTQFGKQGGFPESTRSPHCQNTPAALLGLLQQRIAVEMKRCTFRRPYLAGNKPGHRRWHRNRPASQVSRHVSAGPKRVGVRSNATRIGGATDRSRVIVEFRGGGGGDRSTPRWLARRTASILPLAPKTA